MLGHGQNTLQANRQEEPRDVEVLRVLKVLFIFRTFQVVNCEAVGRGQVCTQAPLRSCDQHSTRPRGCVPAELILHIDAILGGLLQKNVRILVLSDTSEENRHVRPLEHPLGHAKRILDASACNVFSVAFLNQFLIAAIINFR